MKQVKMLKQAMEQGYIVPAFNFANYEILQGLLEAQKATNSPMILQVSESAMNYFGDELLFGLVGAIKKHYKNVSIHLDHGKDMAVVKRAIKLGFDSVMIDGSTLEYNANVKLTKQVVKYAHMHKVSVEGELGVLSASRDDAVDTGEARFTNPDQAQDFVRKTQVDSLAVSIGTNHGINKYVGEAKIRRDILKQIEQKLPTTPIVLHGASLVEQKYVDEFNAFGGEITKSAGNDNLLKNLTKTHICKINMDTDFRLAYSSAVRKYMAEHKDKYCPRTYGEVGKNQVKLCAIDRIKKICHSNGKV